MTIGNTFRLVWFDTNSDNRFDAERRYEFFGEKQSIWTLWFLLTNDKKAKHVRVYSLDGVLQKPEFGINGLVGHNI